MSGSEGVMGYILKYMGKPPELGKDLSEAERLKREFMYNMGLKGFRLCQNFGTWNSRSKNYRFDPVQNKHMKLMCGRCYSYEWITMYQVRCGIEINIDDPTREVIKNPLYPVYHYR